MEADHEMVADRGAGSAEDGNTNIEDALTIAGMVMFCDDAVICSCFRGSSSCPGQLFLHKFGQLDESKCFTLSQSKRANRPTTTMVQAG